jgi:hypothetical protein
MPQNRGAIVGARLTGRSFGGGKFGFAPLDKATQRKIDGSCSFHTEVERPLRVMGID